MSEINKFKLKNAILKSSVDSSLSPIFLNDGNRRTDPDTGSAGLFSLEVEESIFSPTIVGNAVLRDYGGQFDDVILKNLGLGGYDILSLEFETDPVRGGLPIPKGSQKSYKFEFLIYAYSQNSSETKSLLENSTVPRLITLKLASPEFAVMNYLYFEYFDNKEDMIMPISRNYTKAEETENSANFVGPPEELSMVDGRNYDKEGLIQFLISRINQELSSKNLSTVPLKSEDTMNWVWLKKNYNFYPWGKMASAPRLNQLVEMLAENAVHSKWKENIKAANFFFWRTLDSWNFYSLESLVKNSPTRTYILSPNMNNAESIQNLLSSNASEGLLKSSDEADNLALLNSYAFGSNYLFVEPKYGEDPYARYLDSNDAHTISEIFYDYLTDGIYWSKLEQPEEMKPFISSGLNFNDIQNAFNFAQRVKKNRIIDKNYGYYSPSFYNRNKLVDWEYHGYEYSTRQENVLWQTQFDITDLDGQRLLWLQKEIKKPLENKKAEYAAKKNLKEKWKVYKCSICCAGNSVEFTSEIAGLSGNVSTFTFSDPRFEKAYNLRNTASISNYEIVAAGSFSDVVNYNEKMIGVGGSGESGASASDPWVRSGMTLSYDLSESPYNLTLGEFLSLEKKPDNFVKYRFDLEIKRHEKLKEILLKNQEYRAIRKEKYQTAVSGYTAAYTERNDKCTQEQGCTGYCLCPTEYPETVVAKTDLVVGAHDSLADHEEKVLAQIDPMIDKLKLLKGEFEALYDKYWSRKAFFFSRDIDFSFLKSGNNLFNVKSITRKPIRGSKYEPFAVRKALGGNQIVAGPSGFTCQYPYEVPPFVDDLGYMDSTESIQRAGLENNICGVTGNVYYNRGYDYSEEKQYNSDFWASFDSPYVNFPYSEANEERPKGPIWYRNWLVSYEITLIKPPCLNRKPPCFEGDCSCDEIKLNLNMHFETFSNVKMADILQLPNQVTDYALIQLSKNCDGCKIRILSVNPASDVNLYHPWAAEGLTSSSGIPGDFTYEDYKNYKRSSSLFKGKPGITGTEPFDDGDIPPHLVLEGLESYVRVEFRSPIGLNKLEDFPEGFIDTHGSEYFMPYIVLATAGPFGAQSARANIAVIGQDPYGFDLAVKKTKNRDDFAGMNLLFANDVDGLLVDPNQRNNPLAQPYPDLRTPFATSCSWMRTSQNSLFYKPKDGIADLFVPNGIQDIFMASAMEKSFPAKSWWDMWVSLPPIAVATFYNRLDVKGITFEGLTLGGPGVAFYSNNSIVAEPYAWTGGCLGGCSNDEPWPLFLHPDTEQLVSGAFASNVAVLPKSDTFESAEFISGSSLNTFIPGETASILPSDPSNYVYRMAEFPHIVGIGPSGNVAGMTGIERKPYDSISYPVGTLIWGKNLQSSYVVDGAVPGSTAEFFDYNIVNYFDISRKTQYGIVQLSSDSMPSLLSLIGGAGGEIERVQEYQKWISRKLIDWYQNTVFDNNFSAQFVVLSKEGDGCKGYNCMNPEGFKGTDGCPANDPLCNCPCQGEGENKGKRMSEYITAGSTLPSEMVLRPDLMDIAKDRFVGITAAPEGSYGYEPSTLELQMLEREISECEMIKSHPQFGESWLGCVWDDPDSSYNCNCPCLGSNFPEYMKFNRTNATFWSTPLEAPLYRTAQMALFNANKITIDVPGDLYVVTGDVVKVVAKRGDNKYKRFSGNWIVSTIKHLFNPDAHMMRLVLSRELPHPGGLSPVNNANLGIEISTGQGSGVGPIKMVD
jgi:hypothetical protein